jgi:Domain of unknown function (DUF4159)
MIHFVRICAENAKKQRAQRRNEDERALRESSTVTRASGPCMRFGFAEEVAIQDSSTLKVARTGWKPVSRIGISTRQNPRKKSSLRSLLLCVLCASLLFGIQSAKAADQKQIIAAINRGVDYLKSQQKDGHWEVVPHRIDGDVFDVKSGQWSGRTALATWTLLAAGKDESDPAVASAVKFLENEKTEGIYALGIRCQVWGMLKDSPAQRDAMQGDANLLLKGSKTFDENCTGFYGYVIHEPAKENYDHSVSQFGVLGMWSAAEAGLAVPKQYWQFAAVSWMSHQYPDGSWSYKYVPGSQQDHFVSMGAAGVATMLIVQDELVGLGRRGAVDLSGIESFGSKDVSATTTKRLRSLWQTQNNATDPVAVSVDAGVKWLGDHFDEFHITKDCFYTLFGISRVGAASGRKFLGPVDWYNKGADFILSMQQGDGSFNGNGDGGDAVPDTCFALLFLERGLAPVMINKLQYQIVDKSGKPVEDSPHWNDRPRDANNLARWFGHSTERFFNWQVVSLDENVDDLHDAPILYIAGDQALNFSAADEAKLREFVEQGGVILGNADDGRDAFATSFKKLGSHLFHAYEFHELPANHPIYNTEQFLRTKWSSKPSVLSLSNGVRELMILVPHADPAHSWQNSTSAKGDEAHQLAANIYLYLADKMHLQYRAPSYIVRPDANIAAGKPLAIARLYYAGNWNPEPGGWRRLAAVAHNEDHVELTIDPVQITDAPAGTPTLAAAREGGEKGAKPEGGVDTVPTATLGDQPLAHLTGTVSFTLTAAQREALRKYVDHGGTLLVDAAGGSSAFRTSAEAELNSIFGADANQLKTPLDATALAASPIGRELAGITHITFRPGADTVIGHAHGLQLRGITLNGRLAVIFSPEDLSEGLVGQPVDGIVGYSPDSATEITRAILRGLVNSSTAVTSR